MVIRYTSLESGEDMEATVDEVECVMKSSERVTLVETKDPNKLTVIGSDAIQITLDRPDRFVLEIE